MTDRTLRRRLRFAARNVLGLVAAWINARLRIDRRAEPRTFDPSTVPSSARLVVVLGAGVDAATMAPSRMLADRLDAAIEVLARLDRPVVVVTGHDDRRGYNEPEVMRRYLLEHAAIDDEAIIVDPRGHSTSRSIANLAARIRLGGDQVVFVSTDYHLPRILMLAAGHGLDAVGVPAHREYAFIRGYREREELAKLKDWVGLRVMHARRRQRAMLRAALFPIGRVVWRRLSLHRRLQGRRYQYFMFLRQHKRLPVRRDPVAFSDKVFTSLGNPSYLRYAPYVDKHAVREVIAQRIGAAYSAPLIAVLDDPEDFDPAATPHGSIVKPNHLSGAVERFTADTDVAQLRRTMQGWLARNYAEETEELQYRDIPPRIVIEADVSGGQPMLTYSCFVFRGRTEFVYVHDQGENSWQLDRDHRYLQYVVLRQRNWPPLERPAWFGELRELSERLCTELGFEFVRVDWYGVGDRFYFSEFTFTPRRNVFLVRPRSEDLRLGGLIDTARL